MGVPIFEVDEDSDLPLWVQIRNRLAYLINTGQYQAGDQLPTVRKFAADLRISYNTVNKAYVALEREGFISTTRGRGTFVRGLESDQENADLDAMVEDFVRSCLERGLSFGDIPRHVSMCIRKLEGECGHEGAGEA